MSSGPDGVPPLDAAALAHLEITSAAFDRWRTRGPFVLELDRTDAFWFLSALQIASRVNGAHPHLRAVWQSLGRQLQEYLADSPEIYTFMEAGWTNPSASPSPEGNPDVSDQPHP
jgi:hypothetical protein